MNTRKMARRLAVHGQECLAARSGSGRVAPCGCGRSLAFLCACGQVVTLRGGSCEDFGAIAGARANLVVY